MSIPFFSTRRAILAACVLGLVSLALMVWSVLDPRPIPVFVSMSVGQVLGTISLLMFLIAVLIDARIIRRARVTAEHAAATAAPARPGDGHDRSGAVTPGEQESVQR